MKLSDLIVRIETYDSRRPRFVPEFLYDSPQIKALKRFIADKRNNSDLNNELNFNFILFILEYGAGKDFSDNYLNSDERGADIFKAWKNEPPLNIQEVQVNTQEILTALNQLRSNQQMSQSIITERNSRTTASSLPPPQNFSIIAGVQTMFVEQLSRNRQTGFISSLSGEVLSDDNMKEIRKYSICSA